MKKGIRAGGRGSTEKGLRIHKLWSVSMVKIRDALSCEFEMLRLVFADWDMCCSFSSSARISSFLMLPLFILPVDPVDGMTHTYEPKYPPPVKLDMKIILISISPSPSHQADSHHP